MSVERIAARYAKSILDLAIERKEVDKVLQDMQSVYSALRSRDLLLMIKSPIISSGKKLSIFKRLFSGRLSETTNHFFELMIRKGRENHLPEIVDDFIKQYKEYKEISTVRIKTAVPINDGVISTIRQKLADETDIRKNLELEVVVDPSLIGGFTLEFEGKQFDSSIASKLRELRKQFSH